MRSALAVVLLVGCAGEPLAIDPPGDYTTWARIETEGPAPGHGDTLRVIYANDVARTFSGGTYPVGSILVKEIYERDGDERGPLGYVALMRREADGWLFSESAEPNGPEVAHDFCWSYCHQAAPFDGAFLDYSRAMK